MSVGIWEILLILFVVLLVVSPHRIVDLGHSLGRGVYDFKREFGRDREGKKLPGEDRGADPPQKP